MRLWTDISNWFLINSLATAYAIKKHFKLLKQQQRQLTSNQRKSENFGYLTSPVILYKEKNVLSTFSVSILFQPRSLSNTKSKLMIDAVQILQNWIFCCHISKAVNFQKDHNETCKLVHNYLDNWKWQNLKLETITSHFPSTSIVLTIPKLRLLY